MKSRIAIPAAAAAFALLCSCASLFGPKHYDLTEKDSGRVLHLDKGDTFTVLLVTNPSTGFLWEFARPLYDETVMILRGDKYIRPDDQLRTGAPGKRSLTFLAEGSGRTGLKLVYRRPWEKRPPTKEFNIMVIVKDGTESEQKRGPVMRRNSKGELVPDRKRSLLE